MKILKKLTIFPFHVLFLTLYSILSYLATNIIQVDLAAANRLLLFFGLGSLLLLTVTWLIVRDLPRAGVFVFLILVIFYSYGHVKDLLRQDAHSFARNILLIPIAILLSVGGIFLISRLSQAKMRTAAHYLNVVSLLLLVFPVVTITRHEILVNSELRKYRAQLASSSTASISVEGNLPDVYFIILDGYARSDVLRADLGLDNSDFLNGLREEGFYVADCSMSNYAQTEQSMASTLNMTYIDNYLKQIPAGTLAEDSFAPEIKHSQVRQFFELRGYKTVSFFTGYYWAQWEDATYFMGDPRKKLVATENIPSGIKIQMTSFENEYIQTTLLVSVIELYQNLVPASIPAYSLVFSGIDGDRSIVLFPLDNLPKIEQLPGPKFVFLHLLLPHPPYVFGPNGEVTQVDMTDLASRLQGYDDQTIYADKRILPLMDDLISQTKGNVVIILEGDHGLIDYQNPESRMENLSAYYFPDHDYSGLYPRITPVNSFRVLLTQYFGQNYPLLPDKSYFSPTSQDQSFKLIPNTCSGR